MLCKSLVFHTGYHLKKLLVSKPREEILEEAWALCYNFSIEMYKEFGFEGLSEDSFLSFLVPHMIMGGDFKDYTRTGLIELADELMHKG